MTEHEITMLQLKVTMLHLLQIVRKKVVFQKLNIRIKKIWSTYGKKIASELELGGGFNQVLPFLPPLT